MLCQHSLIKQAETSEDLYEWKSALENALALAPSACAMGQNGIFCNDITDSNEASGEQGMLFPSILCFFFAYVNKSACHVAYHYIKRMSYSMICPMYLHPLFYFSLSE